MDGDPKNGTDNNDGGPNKTDPIPVLGGKTQTDVRIQNGQVSLDTMDADLAAAVKSGDEAHVRARLGGDQKLTEAQALILIKTREEEERIAYQQAHPQGAETVDVHRKEGDESIFPWARPNRDWEHDIQTSRFQGQGGAYAAGAVQRDGFIYEADGSRVDATWGFRESRNGVITTRGGDVYDTNKNTYKKADGTAGQFLSDDTLKHTRAAGMSDKDAVVAGARNSEAMAALGGLIGATAGNVAHGVASSTATTGSAEIPQSKKDAAQLRAANEITATEADSHTTGKTQEAIATGKPIPKNTQPIVANFLSEIGYDPASIAAVLNGATGGLAVGMAVATNTASTSTKPVKTPAGQTVVSSKHVKTPADKKTSAQVRAITASTIAVSAAALDNVGTDGTVTVEIPSSIMGVIAQSSSPTKFGSTDAAAVAAATIDKEERQTQKTTPKSKPAPVA